MIANLDTGETAQARVERVSFQDSLLDLLRQSVKRESELSMALAVSRQWSVRWKAVAVRRRAARR